MLYLVLVISFNILAIRTSPESVFSEDIRGLKP